MKKIFTYIFFLLLVATIATAFTCPGTGKTATTYTRGHLCVNDFGAEGSYSCQGTIYVCEGTFYDDYYCALGELPDFVECTEGCDSTTGLCAEGFRECTEGFERCVKASLTGDTWREVCRSGQWTLKEECVKPRTCTEQSNSYTLCVGTRKYYPVQDTCRWSDSCSGSECYNTFEECMSSYKWCVANAGEETGTKHCELVYKPGFMRECYATSEECIAHAPTGDDPRNGEVCYSLYLEGKYVDVLACWVGLDTGTFVIIVLVLCAGLVYLFRRRIR